MCFGQSICRKCQGNSLSISGKRIKINAFFVRAENTRENTRKYFLEALVLLFTHEETLNLAGKGKMREELC